VTAKRPPAGRARPATKSVRRPAPRPRPTRARPRRFRPARAKPSSVRAQTVESPTPFLEVVISESVTEESMIRIFEEVCAKVLTHSPRRVFVDMRQSEIHLSIADLAGLAKLIGYAFSGKVDRLVLLMRPQDILSEKFFEPSVTSRGVPTLVSSDLGDAMHFLTAKTLPLR
jgi:hypothetical protein